MKTELEAASKESNENRDSLNQVSEQRKQKFNDLFNKVSQQMPINYRELTKAAGTASLLISGFEEPFNSTIIFDFTPPGKRNGVDFEMLSGGEKTMAALAFVFALVQAVKPSMLILDEIDAFLDSDNVEAVTLFLKNKLNMLAGAQS